MALIIVISTRDFQLRWNVLSSSLIWSNLHLNEGSRVGFGVAELAAGRQHCLY